VGVRRAAGQVHAATGEFDEEQHVQAVWPDDIDGKESTLALRPRRPRPRVISPAVELLANDNRARPSLKWCRVLLQRHQRCTSHPPQGKNRDRYARKSESHGSLQG